MVEFTSQEAATIKLSTHYQTIIENYEGKVSEQVQVPEFSGCVTKKIWSICFVVPFVFLLTPLNRPPRPNQPLFNVSTCQSILLNRPSRFTQRPVYWIGQAG